MPDGARTQVGPLTLTSVLDAPASLRAPFLAAERADGHWAWFETLAMTTLGQGEQALIAHLDGEAALAALPLVAGRGGQLRALTAPYSCRFSPPLHDTASAYRLGLALGRYLPGMLHLDALDPADDGQSALIAGIGTSRRLATGYRHFANWFEPIDGIEAWRRSRGSRLTATVRRRERRLERAGRLGFRCLSEPHEMAEGADLYRMIYAASWKRPEPHRAFVPRLIEALGAAGMVRLGILSIDGMPEAVQLWLVANRRATIFKLAHRQTAAAYSPGTILTWKMVEALIGPEDLGEIDFGRGDDAYKRDWLRLRRDRAGLVACNPASVRGLIGIARHIVPARLKALAGRDGQSGR